MLGEKTGIEKPYLAFHVRRSDKITEAAYQPVEAYMKYVEEYFEFLDIKSGKKLVEKRVYVASDDPKILDECRQKYPG
jgi:glycoprotein 6-alpha-L-fucosyltransferase